MSEPPNPALPDDLITDILLRLPVKPICRLKSVSKPWQSLLSSPKFIRDHLKLHIRDPEDFILTSTDWTIPDFSPYILTLAAAGIARKVHIKPELKMEFVVAGSCDGLVLLILRDGTRSKILFNPITLETAKVFDDREMSFNRAYGLGYDSLSEDYKIVCLTEKHNRGGSLVDVYSVRMKCWKRIADSPYSLENSLYEEDGPAHGVYLNGCLHWFGRDTSTIYWYETLVCYDLAREEFKEGLFPFERFDEGLFPDSVHGRFAFEVKVLEGCLTLVSEPYGHSDDGGDISIDVWVMSKYGVKDSWTKFTTINYSVHESDLFDMQYNVVCVFNEDEIVLEWDSKKLLAYNWKNETRRDLVIDGIPRCFNRVMPFRESLLSPK